MGFLSPANPSVGALSERVMSSPPRAGTPDAVVHAQKERSS